MKLLARDVATTAALGVAVTTIGYASRPVEHSLFGASLAVVGDLDDDGAPDFAVGDPKGAGRAWVLSGVDGEVIHAFRGEAGGVLLGGSVCGPGDLDGDGVDDVLVGAMGVPGSTPGGVHAYSGASGEELWRTAVDADGCKRIWDSAGFGPALCALGDLDGDGAREIAVGSSDAAVDGVAHGAVRILDGASGEVLHTLVGGRSGRGFGCALALGPDLDGDGVRDLAIGAPVLDTGEGALPSGEVHLVSAATRETIRVVRPPAPNQGAGFTLAFVADRDGDGLEDLLVGQPYPGGQAMGSIGLYASASGDRLGTWQPAEGNGQNRSFGGALAVRAAGEREALVGGPQGLSLGVFAIDLDVAGDVRNYVDPSMAFHPGVSVAWLADSVDDPRSWSVLFGCATYRSDQPGQVRWLDAATGDVVRTLHAP